ncbi:MAG TPA: TIGR03757 family integrating conjugative element protein [Gammaproteobacteria bacterium]|nr:TIGR03757 family integrating conjugative element protein [Gammaproteobacteria bacterium]
MYCPRVTFTSKRYGRVVHYLLLLVSMIVPVVAIDAALADTQTHIEVFTTTDLPFVEHGEEDGQDRGINLQVYHLDGIQLVEAELSKNLSADPAQSEQILLQRIQDMDEKTNARMQRSANGIAKAMQYGIDRYPAIVFDSQSVIYGVTDLETAFEQYQSWVGRE